MEIEDIQTQFASLNKRQSELEMTLQKNQAKYELYTKQLHDEFGITPDKIDAELLKLETEKKALMADLSTNIEKFNDYVTKLEAKLNG